MPSETLVSKKSGPALSFGSNKQESISIEAPVTDEEGNVVEVKRLSDERLDFLEDAAKQVAESDGREYQPDTSEAASDQETESEAASDQETESEAASDQETESEAASDQETESEAASDQETESEAASDQETESEAASEEDVFTVRLADGTEKTLTREEVERELRLREDANTRLQRAAEQERQIQQVLNQQAESAPVQTSASDIKEELKGAVSDLMNGEEDDAVEKLAKIVGGGQQQSVQVDDIVQQAVQATRQELQMQEAISAFYREYPEINSTSDPMAYKMADMLTVEIEKENPSWSPRDILLEAGRRVREFKGGTGTQSEKKLSGSGRKNPAKAKQNLEPMPGISSEKPRKSIDEKEPETPEQIVQNMNIARRGRISVGIH